MFKPIPRFRAAIAVALALTAGSAAGAALAAASAPAAAPVVSIGNFTFGPMTVTVPVGGKVTWVNADDVPHTVMAQDKSFRSKPIDTDERFSFTFTRPGVYSYFCSLHPRMTGKVIVR